MAPESPSPLDQKILEHFAGIRIESPETLRDEHRQKLEAALAVYQAA